MHNDMVSELNNSARCCCFRALNIGFVFLLLGGTLAHADDIVYVSNLGAGTVSEINSSGNESTFASGLNSPEGLAVNSAGNLYVANSGDGTVSQINSAGNVSTFASGLNSPSALAFDPSGNLYVANPGNQTISKINSSGNVSVFVTGMNFFDYGPAYLATDNAGNIYANTFNAVVRFDSNGNGPTVVGGADATQGMAVDGAGNLYLAAQNPCFISGNGSLQISSISDFPAPYNSNTQYDVLDDDPCDLAFDGNGNLFATFSNLVDDEQSGLGQDGKVHDVLMEFGVNGVNRVIATDIGGLDIAVQSIPEPGTFALMSVAAALIGFVVRRRKSQE
jgi:hypothetical protein